MKHFKLEEFTGTGTGLPNVPNAQQMENIVRLVEHVLDPARAELGMPVRVTSGFRSAPVNARVGGAKNSQHTKGEAADLTCADNKRLFDILKKQGNFDQLIWEYGDAREPAWVHVSWSKNQRRQVLRAVKISGQTKYTTVYE